MDGNDRPAIMDSSGRTAHLPPRLASRPWPTHGIHLHRAPAVQPLRTPGSHIVQHDPPMTSAFHLKSARQQQIQIVATLDLLRLSSPWTNPSRSTSGWTQPFPSAHLISSVNGKSQNPSKIQAPASVQGWPISTAAQQQSMGHLQPSHLPATNAQIRSGQILISTSTGSRPASNGLQWNRVSMKHDAEATIRIPKQNPSRQQQRDHSR
ncbi:hypothetical protein ACLOJK_004754 [Asimina triloba]